MKTLSIIILGLVLMVLLSLMCFIPLISSMVIFIGGNTMLSGTTVTSDFVGHSSSNGYPFAACDVA